MRPDGPEQLRIPGIDWLRSIFSLAVVAWHLLSFGGSRIFEREGYRLRVFTFSDLVNFHLLLLAVPVFFLVACFLFAVRKRTAGDLGKRLVRLALLALFWSAALKLFVFGYRGILPPSTFSDALATLVTAGGTPYYFFVSLFAATVITFGAVRLSTAANAAAFVCSCGVVFSLPHLSLHYGVYAFSSFYNPCNFLPYPFAAVLIARNREKLGMSVPYAVTASALLLLGVLFGVYEWRTYPHEIFISAQGYALPAYARLSVVSLSLLAFTAGSLFTRPGNPLICFISRHSLALYCLHPFFIALAFRLGFAVREHPAIVFAVIAGLSYATSVCLRKIVPRSEGIF